MRQAEVTLDEKDSTYAISVEGFTEGRCATLGCICNMLPCDRVSTLRMLRVLVFTFSILRLNASVQDF